MVTNEAMLGFVRDATGNYALGFVLLAVVAVACIVVLVGMLRRRD